MTGYLRGLAVYGALGVVTVAGVYVVRENRALAEENRLLARRAVEPRPGLYVPAVEAATLDGTPVVLGQPGHRQLLFFFNHTCPYCRASLPGWNTIAARVAHEPAVAVFGVALDSAHVAAAYRSEHRLVFPVIAKRDPRLVGLYRVSAVPLVLVLDDGRMAYVRLGVLEAPRAIDSVVAAAQHKDSLGEHGKPRL
ncbi:MAG TPA: redoxin domain-containing protein [Gemmatimonadales bacterium]|nr:redoxin domain-containing protein [Gemmatimonadales bacterium]